VKTEPVRFSGALGHDLAARLDQPDEGEPAVYALFAHCFTCSKDLKAVRRISSALVERGLAVLRFDFTGLGESEGEFAATSFASNVADLLAAVDFLRQRGAAPSLLIGHSLGGAAVLMAASQVPEVKAVATLAAPSDTQHLYGQLITAAPELAEVDQAEVVLAGRSFRIGRALVDDLKEQRVLAAVRKLGKPLLILHSPVDDTVGIEHATRLYKAADHPKSFVSLDQADHLLLRDPADARYAADVLAIWSTRYVGGSAS
jgi:alpha/beta superfamily hydrolase